jgi:hypothetical protein
VRKIFVCLMNEEGRISSDEKLVIDGVQLVGCQVATRAKSSKSSEPFDNFFFGKFCVFLAPELGNNLKKAYFYYDSFQYLQYNKFFQTIFGIVEVLYEVRYMKT